MKNLFLLLMICINPVLYAQVLDQDVLYAIGNEWTYQDSNWVNLGDNPSVTKDTVKTVIVKDTTITVFNEDIDIRMSALFMNDSLTGNGFMKIDEYGLCTYDYGDADSLIFNSLYLKFPVEVSDSSSFMIMLTKVKDAETGAIISITLDTLKLTCIANDLYVSTPAGDYSCYHYRFISSSNIGCNIYFSTTVGIAVMSLSSTGLLYLEHKLLDTNIDLPPPSYLENYGNQVADNFILFNNYPNPFNPSTIISYFLNNSGYVTLKVYDILGRELENLVDQFQIKGNHSVSFNASNLSPGVYFYQIRIGNQFTCTKKMLLLR